MHIQSLGCVHEQSLRTGMPPTMQSLFRVHVQIYQQNFYNGDDEIHLLIGLYTVSSIGCARVGSTDSRKSICSGRMCSVQLSPHGLPPCGFRPCVWTPWFGWISQLRFSLTSVQCSHCSNAGRLSECPYMVIAKTVSPCSTSFVFGFHISLFHHSVHLATSCMSTALCCFLIWLLQGVLRISRTFGGVLHFYCNREYCMARWFRSFSSREVFHAPRAWIHIALVWLLPPARLVWAECLLWFLWPKSRVNRRGGSKSPLCASAAWSAANYSSQRLIAINSML